MKLIRVYGIVQGVGFRPFVLRIALQSGITGSVCNKGPFVEIKARGSEAQISNFMHLLQSTAPKRSAILKIDSEDAKDDGENGERFRIIESKKVSGDVFVSPDIATCDECKAELFDKNNRRYLHPFINCTACGPRLTILDSMPYDRVRTSMKDFPMCADCEWEYTTPSTRRFHAQPVCCPHCGPHLAVIHPAGLKEMSDSDAIIMARDIIRRGGIVAVKGIGGFHLCCDATNANALDKLRRVKDRPTKPFAVMMKDIDTVRTECNVSDAQEAILNGHNKPILLLPRHKDSTLCENIAPMNDRVGVMLPYAPVQLLLFGYPDGLPFPATLVMTSGNPRGAPICRTDSDALETLSSMSSMILSNNRAIRLRADDSVMAWDDETEKPVMIRRSRGYAPLPVMLEMDREDARDDGIDKESDESSTSRYAHKGYGVGILAIGGELKNTFCLSRGSLYYLSPYIGDMADVRSVEALKEAVTRMECLLEITPQKIVCDRHPLYNTRAVAMDLSSKLGVPLLEVQHHWAHVASCMAENGWKAQDGRVIGIAFDGTGYGDDRTIWGGEVLIADYKTFERAASIEPFMQAGGDASSKQGWRIAASLLDDDTFMALHLGSRAELCAVRFMTENRVNAVLSSSCGRLFDAVSAILHLCRESSFEGEAAMRVQQAAEAYIKNNDANKIKNAAISQWHLAKSPDPRVLQSILPTTALVKEIAFRALRGEDAKALAYFFHDALSCMVINAAVECKEKYRLCTSENTCAVALTGGVFSNVLLRSMCRARLEAAGFSVMVHTLVPAGDGGIALGQAALGAASFSPSAGGAL